MTDLKENNIPICPNCKRKSIYFRADGSVKCRSCGYDSRMAKK